MTRSYMPEATTRSKELLDELINPDTDKVAYRSCMFEIGKLLSAPLLQKIDSAPEIYLACTVEDADYLAKGLLDELEADDFPRKVSFACFWNKGTIEPFGKEEFELAPIIKTYKEPINGSDCVLVIVKSIISGACVVATNITDLISTMKPSKIVVVAPVMLEGSEEKLQQKFDEELARRFEYVRFAVDDELDGSSVVPGIGGNVYVRYGWDGTADKNKTTPEVVKSRRRLLAV